MIEPAFLQVCVMRPGHVYWQVLFEATPNERVDGVACDLSGAVMAIWAETQRRQVRPEPSFKKLLLDQRGNPVGEAHTSVVSFARALAELEEGIGDDEGALWALGEFNADALDDIADNPEAVEVLGSRPDDGAYADRADASLQLSRATRAAKPR